MARVTVFLDGSYVFKGGEAVMGAGWRFDMSKLTSALVQGRELQRTYFYNAWLRQSDAPSQYADQQKFIHYLRLQDYFTLRDGRLAGAWPNVRQKGVDVRLALDMVKLAYKRVYDVAVLVSGDADLVEAVTSVQENGQHVELWYFMHGNTRTADELVNTCDTRTRFTPEVLGPLGANRPS